MTDERPSFPELRQATLDEHGLGALERDLRALTTIHACRIKGDPRAMSASVSVAAAFEALRSGSADGLQIDYAHDDRRWRDTLIRRGDGFRLVRIAGIACE